MLIVMLIFEYEGLDTSKLIGNLCELFYEDNPNFDSGKFFEACNPKEKK